MSALAERPSRQHVLDAGAAVIGGVLLAEGTLAPLVVDMGMRPDHFGDPRHQAVFAAMVELADENRAIDVLTVTAKLDRMGQLDAVGGGDAVDALSGAAPAAGNVRDYADIVLTDALWRGRLRSSNAAVAAAQAQDEDAYLRAEAAIGAGESPSQTSWSPERSGSMVFEALNRRGQLPGLIKLPWPRLEAAVAGGLRPGAVTLCSAWSNRGKSIFTDQILEHNAKQGARAALYLNEGAIERRVLRFVAAHAPSPGVSYTRLLEATAGIRELSPAEQKAAAHGTQEWVKLGIEIVHCVGWQVADIDRHMRRGRWDIASVDLVGRIPAPPGLGNNPVAAVDEIDRRLNDSAGITNSHLLLIYQLKRERAGEKLPMPVGSDIRSSGTPYQNADNVFFLYREPFEIETERGPTGVFEDMAEGQIYTGKERDIPGGSARVVHNPRRMRFDVDR